MIVSTRVGSGRVGLDLSPVLLLAKYRYGSYTRYHNVRWSFKCHTRRKCRRFDKCFCNANGRECPKWIYITTTVSVNPRSPASVSSKRAQDGERYQCACADTDKIMQVEEEYALAAGAG